MNNKEERNEMAVDTVMVEVKDISQYGKEEYLKGLRNGTILGVAAILLYPKVKRYIARKWNERKVNGNGDMVDGGRQNG